MIAGSLSRKENRAAPRTASRLAATARSTSARTRWHLRRRRTIPRVRELGHVADGVVDARGAGGVRIGEGAAAAFFGGHVLTPDLGEAEEEALLRGEAVDDSAVAAEERALVRTQSQR